MNYLRSAAIQVPEPHMSNPNRDEKLASFTERNCNDLTGHFAAGHFCDGTQFPYIDVRVFLASNTDHETRIMAERKSPHPIIMAAELE